MAACGGGGKEQPDNVAKSTSTVVSVTSTAPTPTQTSPARATVAPSGPSTLESVFANAKLGQFELDGIRYGGTYRIASDTTGASPNLDPKVSGAVSAWVSTSQLFYDKLAAWVANENDELIHIEPMLAESWKISEDQFTYTFTLRKGVRWQNVPPVNGREIVADDVVFSLRRYMEKDSAMVLYAGVQSVEALDRYTVALKVKEPSSWAVNDLFGKGEIILPPELVQESGGAITNKAVGTGPYILKEWTIRQGYRAVRNPNYWLKDKKGNQLPYLDRIDDVYIAEAATAAAAFRTGQIDSGALGGVENIVSVAKSVPGSRIFLSGAIGTAPTGTPSGISFNTKKAPWDDVRVRRAFNMALDKTKYQTTVSSVPIYASGVPFPWSLISDDPFTDDKLGPYYKYNPQEAKKLLIEAGFPDGKLKVSSTLAYALRRSPNGAVVQQLYKEQGIDVPIQLIDDPVYGSQYYQRVHQDLAFTHANTGDQSLNWYAQNRFLDVGNQNTSFIRDPEIQRTVKAIKSTTDAAKLREYGKTLWDFETLGSWVIWLPNQPGFTIYSGRIRNYTGRVGGGFSGTRSWLWLADAPRTAP